MLRNPKYRFEISGRTVCEFQFFRSELETIGAKMLHPYAKFEHNSANTGNWLCEFIVRNTVQLLYQETNSKYRMSVKLDDIITQLIGSAPPGELKNVVGDLSSIVPDQSTTVVSKSMEAYIEEKGIVLAGQLLASKYNKDTESSKFWDYAGKQKFNYNLESGKAIDFESADPGIPYPDIYKKLVVDLESYGADHYPSEFGFSVIPISEGEVKVILIGQKIDEENFYTGRWRSVYSIDSSGQSSGSINLDIHYYEDGNVRLSYEESVENKSTTFSSSGIVNFINNSENELTLKIILEFDILNQNTFKNLRRLLPVTKSKINWGKAIGTYRLGTDVVNQ